MFIAMRLGAMRHQVQASQSFSRSRDAGHKANGFVLFGLSHLNDLGETRRCFRKVSGASVGPGDLFNMVPAIERLGCLTCSVPRKRRRLGNGI
jgi:hypothetical protein